MHKHKRTCEAIKRILDSGGYKQPEYHQFDIPKKDGSVRHIQAPVAWLKGLQRARLKDLYERTDRPKYAHGFEKNRSVLSNAKVHSGRRFIMNMDIKDFFWNCSHRKARRVIPSDVSSGEFIFANTLPQGSPLSPIIANRIMDKTDDRIVYVLRKYVSDDIRYTRYADDITVSSNSRAVLNCVELIAKYLKSAGFRLNEKKTNRMHPGKRMEVTGLCLNSGKPTVSRKYRRKVRAGVHNAVRDGVSHEKYQRLIGQIGHIMLCHRQEGGELMRKLKTAEVKS